MRHTWASWHVQNGTSLQELQQLGGWSSFDMVLRYAHLSGDHLSKKGQDLNCEFIDIHNSSPDPHNAVAFSLCSCNALILEDLDAFDNDLKSGRIIFESEKEFFVTLLKNLGSTPNKGAL